ncbi:MAG: polyphosphate polymerase domain-containing protein [Corynebacterium sp.]|uniref:polyphosphate polymerase domain-containing protein n=1 Tax=Corynebacterium sp. TaxID=1720 RepID=UPI0026DD149B|nr:polyphosphate polymerase domain-containing protein [Corynebacterium sp.]MDO5098182.1 polyphosphate polymerase domain-containing protein [Corynebacterium sp.]
MSSLALHDQLDSFEAVSLAEILETAELLNRVDSKYCIAIADLPSILEQLDPRTRVLEINSQRRHRYHSVYYDTPDHDNYLNSLRRRRRGVKIRHRWYVDTDTAFCEIKKSGPRHSTEKIRISCAVDDVIAGTLSDESQWWITENTGIRGLTAQLWNNYNRITLLLPNGQGRATIDLDVTWHDRQESELQLIDQAIIETKTTDGRSEINRVLRMCGYRPDGVSKFGAGISALDPQLPRNRFHRSIRQHFPHLTSTNRKN